MAKTKIAWLSKKRRAQALSDLAALQHVADLRNDKNRVAAVRKLLKMKKKELSAFQKEAAKKAAAEVATRAKAADAAKITAKKGGKAGFLVDPSAMSQEKLADMLGD